MDTTDHPTSLAISTTTATSSSTSSSSSFSSSLDFQLVSIKPTNYTSLRDILPSTLTAVKSPKTPNSAYEILITNRLVKQAAWAYLQPMSTTPESGGPTEFHRLWTQFSGAFLRLITAAFDCIFRSIQVRNTSFQL